MHLASRSPVLDFLKLAVANGGDVNLVDKNTGETPLDIVLERDFYSDMKDRVALLIEHKVDLNRYCHYRLTYPVMEAVQSDQYGVALMMLEAGANPHLDQPDGLRKVIHSVLQRQRDLQYLPPDRFADYKLLVNWLEQHGETLDQAQQDEDRWAKRYEKAVDPASFGKVTDQIISERKAQDSKEAALDKR